MKLAELAKLADDNAKLRKAVVYMSNEMKRQHDEINRLRELLRDLEWSGDYDGWPACPLCKTMKNESGHVRGCAMEAALKTGEVTNET